jgi:hypothetical protein
MKKKGGRLLFLPHGEGMGERVVSLNSAAHGVFSPVFRAPLPQILNYPKNQAVVCRKVGKVSDPF